MRSFRRGEGVPRMMQKMGTCEKKRGRFPDAPPEETLNARSRQI
jgi:hypothetical protein